MLVKARLPVRLTAQPLIKKCDMKKILIVEDHIPLSEEINDWFMFEGFETLLASNGRIGIELALKHIPDLILCDIMMPEMDGTEVLSALRKDPVTRLIPFIFMTAMAERLNVRSGMELGADDYVTKPFTRSELLNAVQTRLRKSIEIKEHADSTLNELRSNIINNLPHELRTPLNGLLGFGYMLKDRPASFDVQTLAVIGENIYESSFRLFRLIQNYLIYAQLELKKTDNEVQTALEKPYKICEKIVTEISAKYDRSNDLELDLSGGIAYIEELEFSKVVEELTDNAFKFSKPGSKIIISCGQAIDKFHFTIEDFGRGIDAAEISRIGAFMQFNRKLHEQQGSGLGLVIARRIVDLFDGKMIIESTPGKGSKFILTFPGRVD
jgi:two-component system sensor histidine kinase/response regulator